MLTKVKGMEILFHPKCKKTGIMELFADNLLVFTKPGT